MLRERYVVTSSHLSINCATSTDGIEWTTQSGLDTAYSWRYVGFINGKFVTTSLDGQCALSVDGATWTIHELPLMNVSSVLTTPDRLYARGDYSETMSTAVITTVTGEAWSPVDMTDIVVQGVCYGAPEQVRRGVIISTDIDGTGHVVVNGEELMTRSDTYTRSEIEAKFAPKVVSQTVTHDTVPEEDLSKYHIGKPVFMTGNVYMYRNNAWVPSSGSPTDCICGVKTTGSYKVHRSTALVIPFCMMVERCTMRWSSTTRCYE